MSFSLPFAPFIRPVIVYILNGRDRSTRGNRGATNCARGPDPLKSVAATLCAAFAGLIAGQAVTATILGTIMDSSGAAIPGTDIQAKNTATGITQSTISDEPGRYRIPGLGIGEYEVQLSKPGFQSVGQKNVTEDHSKR